jgi:hypothetical protein
MSEWTPYIRLGQTNPDAVTRVLDNGAQESRLAFSFTQDDPDYAAIMQLVADGKLTIGAAE